MKNFFNFLWEVVKMIVISLAIIVPVRYFLIQPFYVKGASMEPSFHDHEYLIIDEISYRLGSAERGDIVVFKYPLDPREYYIKRLIGLPGETIEIKNGDVYIINEKYPEGIKLEETYLPENLKTYSYAPVKIQLGPDEYYVLGDNRNASKDSRSFGPVEKRFFIGKVFFRGWPLDKAGLFPEVKYQF